ncbi:uncharacterized protein LOC115665364 [Syzygium oleosum]|uniref:uncharacterized protein LOC115665364 n=1 Tax=Syzygium oleosum TaxID=219896 RepID=UPI0011D1CBC2|nr:uncharacterized protein LOC115665364 [Syzygium oleosum]
MHYGVKLLKGLYFYRKDFWHAEKGYRPSWGWQSILKGREAILNSVIWVIGNGEKVNIRTDRWLKRGIIGQVWKARNNQIFRGVKPNAKEVVGSAWIMHQSVKKWSIRAKTAEKRGDLTSAQAWAGPAEGILKINIDGSLGKGSTDSAIAFICRDYSGCLVDGFVQNVRASSPAQIETPALLAALKYVERNKVERVELESDRIELISALRQGEEISWEVTALITECYYLLSRVQGVRLKFCPRTANYVADWVARTHRKKCLPSDWLYSPPQALWALLCNDAPCLGPAS